MLIRSHKFNGNMRHAQQGVVLMMALIMLVALTLAGIALVRSVDTTNLIAGNLAFKQAATSSGDRGTEDAVVFLNGNKPTLAGSDNLANGYRRYAVSPAAGQGWSAFFDAIPAAEKKVVPADSVGNSIEYVIHRLCTPPVAPATVDSCAVEQTASNNDGNKSGDFEFPIVTTQSYYRVTTKVTGPRNTVSYIQTVVSM
jgi:Tfp pilus assembly protein PilX